MKHTANFLTALRIALTLLIPAFLDDRTICVILFAAAGLTDVLDGVVARRLDVASKLGARLDSLADMVMFGVMIACAVVWTGAGLLTLMPYLIAVALIRFANLAIAARRFHQFAMIHTWANKLTGLLIFIGFGVYILTDSLTALIPVIAAAGLAALEETAIMLTSKELDLDRKSLFVRPEEKG